MAVARAATVRELAAEIDARAGRRLPARPPRLTGEWERRPPRARPSRDTRRALARALARGRERDAAAGRALTGPHRGDLEVVHGETGRAGGRLLDGRAEGLAAEPRSRPGGATFACIRAPNPILLLDEVAAHLDPLRAGGAVRRNRGAGAAGLPDRDRRLAVRRLSKGERWACGCRTRGCSATRTTE